MANKFVTAIFGDYSKKEVKKVKKTADKVLALEEKYASMSDKELTSQTDILKGRLANGETLDDILPDAFAVCREGAWRVLGMKHFPVQIIGGIVLHQGRIAEMKTGEGKTLVATLPAYLNALTGEGVHIVTVNDYLAKRDSEWMGKLYRFLGLKVGLIIHEKSNEQRQEAYNADITYGTNNEMGFDYLRDNMVQYKEDKVQRGHVFAIVDEVDSILIDEARTPLIISGKGEQSTDLYRQANAFAKTLKMVKVAKMDEKQDTESTYDGDYIVDEKAKTATLTQDGVKKAEEYFHVENLMDMDNTTLLHHIDQAIKANGVMRRDIDYVVADGQVKIVDEFTGRIMEGRRYNEGLHQAIEAKEGVKVEHESKTLATITFQNYFRLYKKLSGMTGTASTEAPEFSEIYKLDVVEIPTNKPLARIDHPDVIFQTERGKYHNVIEQIKKCHEKGQPVLVGTITIETSELLSEMLRKKGIPHNVLNAKYHELEAQIVSEAGRHGAVTIATNMAGRGTDIKLDDEAVAAGGLKIIGTERHESRRIDNQLRGRSGRQGDPGESRFYISLEDDLMRLFAQERLMNIFNSLGVSEDEQIEHKMLSKAIETAQKKIETNNFGIRSHLLEYDQVMNEQREIMYAERRRVLDGESMRNSIMKMITDYVENVVNRCVSEDKDANEWDYDEINELLLPTIPIERVEYRENIKNKNELIHDLKEKAVKLYEDKEALFPEAEQIREIERVILLKVIDRKWMDHIDDMDQLKQGIGLQALGQRDPVVQYKMMGYDMFDEMTAGITEDTVRLLMHIQVEQKVEREQVAKVTGTNKDQGPSVKGPARRTEKKIYPNDPCPCGSGKKYKNCCGRQA